MLWGSNGAVCYIGATRDTVYLPEVGFFAEFLGNREYHQGAAFYKSNPPLDYMLLGDPELEIINPPHGVEVSLNPGDKSGIPGEALTYTVTVRNIGNSTDTYALTATDDVGWCPSISPTSLTIPVDESRTATLTVIIPRSAMNRVADNITVTAAFIENAEVCTSRKCVAYAAREPTGDATVSDRGIVVNRLRVGYVEVHDQSTGIYRSFLKFDLSDLPTDAAVISARLNLYCNYISVTPFNIEVRGVADDSWSEAAITWSTQPTLGNLLDSNYSNADMCWYNWDVTNFVSLQLKNDRVASFCLKHPTETYGDSDEYAEFYSKEWGHEYSPYLEVIYVLPHAVDVSISPNSKSGAPGSTLTHIVTVRNTGSETDTYDISVSDSLSWNPSISPSSLTVVAEENGATTLTVTIPDNATIGAQDEIFVTTTSQADPSVSDSNSCIAQAVAPARGVEVSISPSEGNAAPGENLIFTATIKNTGNVEDIYDLSASDTEGWLGGCTTNVSVSADSYVHYLYPDTNYGSSGDIHTANTSIFIASYLKFDISSISGDIIDATLWVRNNRSSLFEWVSCFGHQNDGWQEDTLTLNNRPQPDPSSENFLSENISSGSYPWVSWEVTSFVKAQKQKDNVITLLLRNSASTGYVQYWRSKEYSGGSDAPYLEVTTSACISPPTLTVTPGESRQATLTVTIPENVEPGTEDVITVTATSQADQAVSASASCVARAEFNIYPSDYVWAADDQDGGRGLFDSSTRLVVGPSYDARTYLKFSLSGIPSDALITGAKLWLYCYKVTGDPKVDLHRIDDTNGWNREPGPGWGYSRAITSTTVDTENRWYSWDVASWDAASWIRGEFMGDKVVSFQLDGGYMMYIHGCGGEGWKEFYSMNGPYKPYLEVTYTIHDSILYPIADATINSRGGNDPSGSLLIGDTKGNGMIRNRAWLKFDLSGIPAGATVEKAYLNIRFYWCGVEGGAPGGLDLYLGGNDWTEGGINWSNQPSINSTPTDHVSEYVISYERRQNGGDPPAWKTFDVTSDVQQYLSSAISWCLKSGDDESDEWMYSEGNQRESGIFTSPYLEIYWH